MQRSRRAAASDDSWTVDRNQRTQSGPGVVYRRSCTTIGRRIQSVLYGAPSHNRITAGRWFADGSAELSIEEGIAETLGIKLGDSLTFDIAGQLVNARATSLRKVNWDSMRANFFVIMPPSLLKDMPTSFITAFHLPVAQANLTGELLQQFPNLTVVDMTAVFRQVQAVIDQVITAVEFLFVFTLAAGVLVLYAALARAATSGCAKPVCCVRSAPRGGNFRALKSPRCSASAVLRAARGDRRQCRRVGACNVWIRIRIPRLALGIRCRCRRRFGRSVDRRLVRIARSVEDAAAGDAARSVGRRIRYSPCLPWIIVSRRSADGRAT